MNKLEKIKQAFDSAPSRPKLDAINQQIIIKRRELEKLNKEYSQIQEKIDQEEDKIANKLDKEIGNWRELVRKDWMDRESEDNYET